MFPLCKMATAVQEMECVGDDVAPSASESMV